MEEKLKRWIAACKAVDTITKRAVEANETEILDANTAQLEVGKDSMGRLLDDYASDEYAQYKKAEGSKAPLGTPNLYLEGNFYAGWFMKYASGELKLDSSDSKRDKLVQMYGEDIFGLSVESLTKLRPDIAEAWLNEFRSRL